MAAPNTWDWLDLTLKRQGWTAYGETFDVPSGATDQHSAQYTESPWVTDVNEASERFGHQHVGMFGLAMEAVVQKKLYVRTEILAAAGELALAAAS